jgi:hypothetical protein
MLVLDIDFCISAPLLEFDLIRFIQAQPPAAETANFIKE